MGISRWRAATATAMAAILATVPACGESSPAPGDAPGDPALSPEPPATLQLQWELVVAGLVAPNDLADLGDGRLLISDQVGRIHLWNGATLIDPPVLDLTEQVLAPTQNRAELGLSGFAPHPDFLDNGRLFVFSTRPPGPDDDPGTVRVDVLSELTVPPAQGAGRADPAAETVLLRIAQSHADHVGGHLVFGDDGLLYLGLGDSGQPEQAQEPDSLQGTIVRIDVDQGDPYAIPPDNPFVSGGGAPEVFAYGFRNPFRISWHDDHGLLVAEPLWTEKNQEVNVAVAGANYGYPTVAPGLIGRTCFPDAGHADRDGADPVAHACRVGPAGDPLEPPVLDYGTDVGQIVSGAVSYRGTAIPELAGTVVVADWRGNLLAATPSPQLPWPVTLVEAPLLADQSPSARLWALDVAADGEVYGFLITTSFRAGDGAVYRLAPASAAGTSSGHPPAPGV